MATANSAGETKPMSSWIGSANILVSEDDSIMWQRLILILFYPLDTSNVWTPLQSAMLNQEWEDCKEMIACLLPDLYSMLLDGKLDKEALNDCCTYMNEATGHIFYRNFNFHGYLLYYVLCLTVMTQGDADDIEPIFEYMCSGAVRQNYIATRFTSVLDQFVLALHQCRSNAAANPLTTEEKSIHHHNYRTSIKPEGAYVAVRLESVCHVINNVLKQKFKPDEIRRAVEEAKEGYASFGPGQFYDLSRSPFPISKMHVDEETMAQCTVPLPEEELLEGTLKLERCLFIKKANFDKIVHDAEHGHPPVKDYKNIMIKSACERYNGGEPYNFYKVVSGQEYGLGWFGYRCINFTPFSTYCGLENLAHCIRDSEFLAGIEEMQMAANFPPVDQCFSPSFFKQFYSDKDFVDPNALPPCFRLNPFMFRNADDDLQMPSDPRTMHYEKGLIDDCEDPRYFSEFSPSTPGRAEQVAEGVHSPMANRGDPGSSRQFGETTPSVNTSVGGSYEGDSVPAAPKISRKRRAVVIDEEVRKQRWKTSKKRGKPAKKSIECKAGSGYDTEKKRRWTAKAKKK